VYKVARMIEGLGQDHNIGELMSPTRRETLRGLSISVTIGRSTECDLPVRELGFTNEAFSLDGRPTVTGSIS